MSNPLLRLLVRTKFALTSRPGATRTIREEAANYRRLLEGVDSRQLGTPVTVPAMPGVDEDMRGWSLLAICEHNAIVNRSIQGIVRELVTGEAAERIDPKSGVMPGDPPAADAVEDFFASIDAHLEEVSEYSHLRGTGRIDHPLFGPFDAHRWHCMFGFHLMLHRRQARQVIRQVRAR